MSVTHSRPGPSATNPTLHKVLVHGRQRAAAAVVAPVTDTGQAGGAHEAGHSLPTAGQPEPQAQLGVHPGCAVSAAGGRMHLGDRGGQLLVGDDTGTGGAAAPLVEARTGDPQHPAGHRDVDAVRGELMDQPVDL
jgi:hypothetical protein